MLNLSVEVLRVVNANDDVDIDEVNAYGANNDVNPAPLTDPLIGKAFLLCLLWVI